jgi:hypothetical protein
VTPTRNTEEMLRDRFDPVHADAAVEHFRNTLSEFQKRDWEQAILKAGKFVEAILKALWIHVGGTLPADRDFKAGKIMDDLERLPKGTHPDALRITVPRACRFIYDIASNRPERDGRKHCREQLLLDPRGDLEIFTERNS